MKNLFISAFIAVCALPAFANHPDSVYVRPDVRNGVRDFQIAYSIDGNHWTHVSCNLFESDYGTWGSEKKLYYPVLSYDGKMYHATFIPNPKNKEVYDRNYEVYKTLYKNNKEAFKALNA